MKSFFFFFKRKQRRKKKKKEKRGGREGHVSEWSKITVRKVKGKRRAWGRVGQAARGPRGSHVKEAWD